MHAAHACKTSAQQAAQVHAHSCPSVRRPLSSWPSTDLSPSLTWQSSSALCTLPKTISILSSVKDTSTSAFWMGTSQCMSVYVCECVCVCVLHNSKACLIMLTIHDYQIIAFLLRSNEAVVPCAPCHCTFPFGLHCNFNRLHWESFITSCVFLLLICCSIN